MVFSSTRLRRSTCLTLLALALPATSAAAAAAPAAAVPCATALVQDDEKPDKRPEVKEMLGKLKEHASKRGKEDAEAIAVIDSLIKEFENSGPKDRASIAKGIGATLKQKRGMSDENVPQNQMFLAAGTALGLMAPESVKVIEGWIGHKTHRKDLALQRILILSLGESRDPKAAKTLIDLLVHKDATLQGAAAESLGKYDGADQKLRKQAFEGILKILTGTKTQMDADPQDRIARERYDAIAAPMSTALVQLSGQDSRKPEEWRRFWNKNKKKDWDEELGG